MKKTINRNRKLRRVMRVSKLLIGTSDRPRICMYRSHKFTYAQLIDDGAHTTIMSVTTNVVKADKKTKSQAAFEAGKILGEQMKKAHIAAAIFDRRGYAYNGRVKQFAEGVRASGITL